MVRNYDDVEQLQEQLKRIQYDSKYLFDESSLFQESQIEERGEAKKEEESHPTPPVTIQEISAIQIPDKKEELAKQITVIPLTKIKPSRSINLVKRTAIWAEQRRNKILEGERQKHKKQVKECSFKPRLNMSHERSFSNISNIALTRHNKENVPQNNKDSNWKETTIESIHLIRKIEEKGKRRQPQKRTGRDILIHQPIINGTLKVEKQPSMQQYIELVEEADELFKQVKRLKEINRELLQRVKRK